MPDSLSADMGECDVRSFFAPFVVEASAVQSPASPSTGSRRSTACERTGFFVPLATESHALHAAVAEEPDVFRKRKRRSETPFVAIVACVGGCLLMVGLIVYQKTKSHAGAANAVKGVVEGELNCPGVAGSPRVAGHAKWSNGNYGSSRGQNATWSRQRIPRRNACSKRRRCGRRHSFAAPSSGLPLWHDRVDRSIVSVHWSGPRATSDEGVGRLGRVARSSLGDACVRNRSTSKDAAPPALMLHVGIWLRAR